MSFTVYCPLLVWWAGGVAPLVHWALGLSVCSVQKSLVLSNLDEDSTTSDLSPLGMKNHALVILCT